jgi:hypothetical protein
MGETGPIQCDRRLVSRHLFGPRCLIVRAQFDLCCWLLRAALSHSHSCLDPVMGTTRLGSAIFG